MGRVARYELANTVSRLETAAADLEEAAASNLAIFKAARTEGTARAELARSRRARMLPRRKDLDKVTRYETHLERSLSRMLRQLQEMRAPDDPDALPSEE